MRVDPCKYFVLVPAQPSTVWHLEWSGDKVRVFCIRCARTNGRRCLADKGRQLFNEEDAGKFVLRREQADHEHSQVHMLL